MSETTLAELKQEVKALRLIVYSLADQIERIHAKLDDLNQENQSKTVIDSNASQNIESDSATDSTSDRTIEQNSAADSTSERAIEQNNSTDSTSGITIKQNSSTDSTSEKTIKQNNSNDSTSERTIEQNRAIDSNRSLTWGMNEINKLDALQTISSDEAIAPLPSELSQSIHNIYAISGRLRRAGFGGGKESPCVAAAKLFLYFYNEQPGEYKYLRKLTDYSEGGLGKLLMRLRAQGYLVKTGFQQHAITGKALELMQQAQCK